MIKIVLDASAIERLIGGNEEFAIEIRQSIASEFASRYLKGAVTSEIKSLTKDFLKHNSSALGSVVAGVVAEVKSNMRSELKQAVIREVDAYISESVYSGAAANKAMLIKAVEDKVEQLAIKLNEQYVERIVEEKLLVSIKKQVVEDAKVALLAELLKK